MMFFPVQVQLKLALVVYVAYIGWYMGIIGNLSRWKGKKCRVRENDDVQRKNCSNEKTYLL
jgi:hypothetical protein